MLVTNKGALLADDNGPPVKYVWSPRRCTLAKVAPIGIVWHYTAALGCEAMTKRLLTLDAKDMVSWHILVGETGTIYQSVPLTSGAWHVRKAAPNTPATMRGGVNRWLLGIELESKTGASFTPAQTAAARGIVAALHAWRPDWPRAAFEWGHRDFDPGRRADPGDVWVAALSGMLDGVIR